MEIEKHIADAIQQRLSAAEAEHDVKVIYACESGSRAWGFASPDSDYDVRFLYAHKPEWYLSFDVERRRDVIEYPIVDEIDIGGWDIKKALSLFTRTNGALLEWIQSPIVYRESGQFAQRLRQFAPKAHNDLALRYHYIHMAKANAGDHLLQDQVKLKKYFYILRPIMAVNYMEAGLGLPPVRFQEMVEAVAPANIKPIIADLIETKSVTPEIGFGDAIQPLNEYINAELAKHEGDLIGLGRPELESEVSVNDELNSMFRQTIYEAAND